TEEATPKRRQEAREEGNITRSQDLAGALLLTTVTVALIFGVMPMLGQGKTALENALSPGAYGDWLRVDSVGETMLGVGTIAVRVAAPLLILAWVAAYLSGFVQVGWLISPQAAKPRLSKLNPLKGFQRIFGLPGLVKV